MTQDKTASDLHNKLGETAAPSEQTSLVTDSLDLTFTASEAVPRKVQFNVDCGAEKPELWQQAMLLNPFVWYMVYNFGQALISTNWNNPAAILSQHSFWGGVACLAVNLGFEYAIWQGAVRERS
jgi:hypothetical protein